MSVAYRARSAGSRRLTSGTRESYEHRMPKRAVSVTLERENLLWLRAQAQAPGRKSVSEVLDRLVTEARRSGRVDDAAIRSVVGTIRIASDDPDLRRANVVVRALFANGRAATRRGRTSARRRTRG